MRRIGADTGGTFTDAVLWDEEQGLLASAKVSSRPDNPAAAAVEAARRVASSGAAQGTDPQAGTGLRDLVHGTTVATNACLERSGPRVALLTTAGFRDVLEIGRLMRPPKDLYDLLEPGPRPLIARRDRLEIDERMDADGKPLGRLDEAAVRRAADVISARGITSVAVSYLHAHLNPEHEIRTAEILREYAPHVSVSLSSDVLPVVREYERTCATALNAYLVPVAGDYLRSFQSEVDGWEPDLRTWIMQSNGGVTSGASAADTPVNLLLSGPSGGAVAGRWIARQTGYRNAITVDMGGTSFDVCLLAEQQVPITHERVVMDLPVHVPTVDIAAIGTGGGSIARVDAGGQLLVGPASAGSDPGPAAYGRGGTEPTVTDANLVLGVLEDGQRLGDDVVLDRAAAYAACARLGRTLGLDAVEVARGIRRISNAAMAGAVQAVSVGRGLDPRDFALLAFGGAGPMHAVDIARELAIPTVVVPPAAGCLSALGLVVSDVVHDYAVSFPERLAPDLASPLEAALGGLTGRAREQLRDEGFELAGQVVQPSLDMRYAGQNSSITVPITGIGASGWLDAMAERFHQAHEQVNGFRVADEPIDIVTARVRGTGQLARDPVSLAAPVPTRPPTSGVRLLRLAGADQVEASRYQRGDLTPGAEFTGPAVVESADTTIVIPPRVRADVDAYGNLLLHLEAV